MFDVHLYDSVSSTNNLIKEAIDAGEPHGYAVAAKTQTEGYGRQGRHWESPQGGMYVSLLLRPTGENASPKKLPTLSLVVGLAVRTALQKLLPTNTYIYVKWPNDVVVLDGSSELGANPAYGVNSKALEAVVTPSEARFSKLCGISLEKHKDAVCVGIGVNVFATETDVPEDDKNIHIYMYRNRPYDECEIDRIRSAVLKEVERRYEEWLSAGFEQMREEYEEWEILQGHNVTIEDINGQLIAEGKACGVSSNGELLIEASDGQTVAVSSGEAHVR